MSADDVDRLAEDIVGALLHQSLLRQSIANIAQAIAAARAEGIRCGRAQAVAEILERAGREQALADGSPAAQAAGTWYWHDHAAEVLRQVAGRIEALTSTDAATANTR